MKKTWNMLGLLGLYGLLVLASPLSVQAAEVEVETSTSLYAKIDSPNVEIRDAASADGQVMAAASSGQTYEIVESGKDGWIKIETSEGQGFIPDSRATIIEKTTEKVDEGVALRRGVVDYALQFVGNPYVYGGTDPNRGADCSGFTRYIMMHAAGISLAHNSTAQSKVGQSVSFSDIRPGDLIFYGGASSINHVALYIGNGQVVHASTERTGIKISDASYRNPVKVVSILN